METLTDLQNTAFLAIGPSRIAALSILSLLREGGHSAEGRSVVKLSKTRVEKARDMLGGTLPQLLSEMQHKLPATLEEKRIECLEQLEPVLQAVSTVENGGQFSDAQLQAFADHCLYALEPKVTEFLDGMTQNLLDTHAQRLKERETEMMEAITNAEAVGRNIQLIAFNASIEAARIGDMGRGFAVIATEIRQLSGKTQVLLDDIADLLRSA